MTNTEQNPSSRPEVDRPLVPPAAQPLIDENGAPFAGSYNSEELKAVLAHIRIGPYSNLEEANRAVQVLAVASNSIVKAYEGALAQSRIDARSAVSKAQAFTTERERAERAMAVLFDLCDRLGADETLTPELREVAAVAKRAGESELALSPLSSTRLNGEVVVAHLRALSSEVLLRRLGSGARQRILELTGAAADLIQTRTRSKAWH